MSPGLPGTSRPCSTSRCGQEGFDPRFPRVQRDMLSCLQSEALLLKPGNPVGTGWAPLQLLGPGKDRPEPRRSGLWFLMGGRLRASRSGREEPAGSQPLWESGQSERAGSASPHVHICSLSAEEQLPPGFPSIDMGPQLKVVEKARTATMLCAAGGNPDPEISWFKDFLPVDPATSNGRIKQLRSGEHRVRVKGPRRRQERPEPSAAFAPGHGCLGPSRAGLRAPGGWARVALGPPGRPGKRA